MRSHLALLVVACTLTLCLPQAAAAQAPSDSTPRCYRLAFERDSSRQWFPDRLQWSPTTRIALVAWDSTSGDAREMRRQTRGNARWRRVADDSIEVRWWSTFVSSGDFRFVVSQDTLRGSLNWYGETSDPELTIQLTGVRQACPIRDHGGT